MTYFSTKCYTQESLCSKPTKYCLPLFSSFYLILRFGGAKTINPNPLSTRPHWGKKIDSTDTLIHQNMGILHNMTILLPIGTKFYQQPNAVSSIEFSTWQAPFLSLLMNAPVLELLPWYVGARLRSNSTRNVRVTSSSALMLSAGALLGGVVASLLRQNHRTPPLPQSFFRRTRGARRDTVWRFSGGLDISQKRTFPIQFKCIFCTHHTIEWQK